MPPRFGFFLPNAGVAENFVLALPAGHPTFPELSPNNGKRYGFFHVTNIMKSPKDGHYYFFTLAAGRDGGLQRDGLCLMRALAQADLANPNSWHSWAGGGAITHPNQQQACTPIQMPAKMGSARFLGYSTYFRKYILLSGGTDGQGFYFALSDSLTEWPRKSYLVPFYTGKTLKYLTLIDPAYAELVDSLSESLEVKRERRNFDLVGKNPLLFFVEDTGSSKDPVLKKIPLQFFNAE